jgi:hypothetical protein
VAALQTRPVVVDHYEQHPVRLNKHDEWTTLIVEVSPANSLYFRSLSATFDREFRESKSKNRISNMWLVVAGHRNLLYCKWYFNLPAYGSPITLSFCVFQLVH